MKKIIIPLMAIAAFATACQVEDLNEANQGQQNGELFTIEAAITPSTKTSLTVEGDAYKVDWDADDALSVVAKYSGGSYSGNEFTKGEGNTFSGTVTNPGDITELNVVYPYDDYIKDIDSEGYFNGYVYFGSRSDESQNQTGLNSAAHINGPLYGYATVSSENTVVQMKHASTLFEINVTNNSGIDINVSNIKLTNSESKNMVGTFYINPQTGALKEGKYVASTVSLNASNATITNGETGSFYITSAPFELAANSNITVTVTANGQETEIVKTVSEATSFVAGTVNHLNVTIKEAQEIQPIEEGQYLIAAYNNGAWTVMTPENGGGYFLPIVTEVSVPIEEVAYSDFYSVSGINNYDWTIEATEDGYSIRNSQGYIAISDDNVDYSQTSTSISILKNADGTYNIAGIGATNYLKYNTNSGQERFKLYGSSNKFPVVVLIPWVDDPDYKYCDVTPEIINVSADAGETSFNISSNTTWTISSSNPAYELSQSEGEGNAEITITYPANTTEDNINVIFTISSTSEPKTVTLNQQSASVIPIDVLTADGLGLGTSSYANFSNKSFTSLAQYAGNAMKNNKVGAIQIRSSKNNSGIVSTHSGGIAKEVSIECSSEQSSSKTLDIYGSNTPYSSASDLYDSATQGTKLGSIQCTENGNGTLAISGEYKYIGIRSSSGAIYLSSITITWGE